MSRLLYDPITTNVDHVSSVTETTWASWVIPANTLKTNQAVQVTVIYDFLNNTGGADFFTLRIKYGATTMFGEATVAIAAGAERRAGLLTFILAADGATNAQVLGGTTQLSALSATSVAGLGDFAAVDVLPARTIGGSAAIDSTAAQTLAVTVQNNLNNANFSTRLLQAFVEAI